MLSTVYMPYGGYYSSPFARWQGSLQNENSIVLGASTAKRWINSRGFDAKIFDYLVFGKTVGQHHTFFSAPWAAAMLGATEIPGMHISQACSTATTCIIQASLGVEAGFYENVLCLMTDRTSNGPHTIWPNPSGPGGQVISEDWVMDNFNADPWGGVPMVQTAENTAQNVDGITKELCDEVTYRRYEQYLEALKNNREFQKRYMFPVEFKKSKNEVGILEADEGVISTNINDLAKLKPLVPGGVHSYGSQTHPADGNCGLIVTTRENSKILSADPNVEIQIISYGYSRAPKTFMGIAPVPAAKMALEKARIDIKEIKAIKTHNPFIANDIYFAKMMGVDVMSFNNYGSSIIFGHPQAPTAGRCIVEMVEELLTIGGGYGLFTGCAAGDTGAALLIKLTV